MHGFQSVLIVLLVQCIAILANLSDRLNRRAPNGFIHIKQCFGETKSNEPVPSLPFFFSPLPRCLAVSLPSFSRHTSLQRAFPLQTIYFVDEIDVIIWCVATCLTQKSVYKRIRDMCVKSEIKTCGAILIVEPLNTWFVK